MVRPGGADIGNVGGEAPPPGPMGITRTASSISSSSSSSSESIQMLSSAARETKTWLIGGSIPELEESDAGPKYYNTSIVFSPDGDLVAKHRKMHLFDIDIPGKITFKVGDTRTRTF